MKRIFSIILTMGVLLSLAACGNSDQTSPDGVSSKSASSEEMIESEGTDIMENHNTPETVNVAVALPEGFVAIPGGTYLMGSPETENWRGSDETQHEVTVSDFAMCVHEVTQAEYEEIVGDNPSSFVGEDLPVDSVYVVAEPEFQYGAEAFGTHQKEVEMAMAKDNSIKNVPVKSGKSRQRKSPLELN